MLGGLVRLILFRVVGARVMLGIAIFSWLRRMLSGRRQSRRPIDGSAAGSAYQPSQGESQIVHRDPR